MDSQVSKEIESVYKNLSSQLHPQTEKIIQSGKIYLKEVHASTCAFSTFLDEIHAFSKCRPREAPDVDATLETLRTHHAKQLDFLKSLYTSLLHPLESSMATHKKTMATQFNSYEKQMNKAKKLDAEKQIFNKVMDAVGVVFGVQSCGSGPVGLFPDEQPQLKPRQRRMPELIDEIYESQFLPDVDYEQPTPNLWQHPCNFHDDEISNSNETLSLPEVDYDDDDEITPPEMKRSESVVEPPEKEKRFRTLIKRTISFMSGRRKDSGEEWENTGKSRGKWEDLWEEERKR